MPKNGFEISRIHFWALVELPLYHTISTFNDPEIKKKKKKPIENIVGKGENADNQHFFPFPTLS